MRLSVRLYRLLLKCYPATFRERYEVALERQFKDEYADVTGRRELGGLWIRTLVDFARSMPSQVAHEIGQDSRHALRTWRRSPLQALSILAVLAIAVGANTGVYSILDALLLRSLPFAEPHRLASLDLASVPLNDVRTFDEWRQQSPYLADGAVYMSLEGNLDTGQQSGRGRLTETSRTFFPMLGVRPIIGRGFEADDETAGRAPVAIIGHGFWLQQFGGDTRALGSSVRINGVPLTIIGVAPPGFDYPLKTQIWSPTVWDFVRIPKTEVTFRTVIGRLRPELSWGQAREAFEVEMQSRQSPGRPAMGAPPRLTPLRESLAGPLRQASFVLMAGTVLLLFLACANIANVLLARTLSRATELKIRHALGASRARLIQQVLTETVLMAAIAGTIGLLVAWWSTRLAALVQPPSLTSQAYEVLDWRVLGFSAALTLITGVIFGVAPAVYAVRGCFAVSSRTATPSTGQGRASGLLVAAQMTITIVLLTGSLALGRTFVGLLQVNPGFDVRPLVSLHVSFAGAGYEGGRAREYYLEAIQRMRQVPGVVAASATQFLPLASGAHMASRFTIDSTGPETLATFVPIAPEYFRTLGTRVLAGREFTPSDLSSGESIVIINEELARVFGHPASAVGRRLVDARSARTIVGVVQGMRDSGPTYAPEPQAFVPSRSPASLIFVARVNGTTGAARDYLAPIRAAVAAVDPKVPVFDVKTMGERLDETLARPKVYATSVIFFGGLALLMAIVGLHGVVAHAVARRTREMAIRLALGTTPSRLRSRMLGRALGWVLLGAIPGSIVTLVSGGYLRNLIRGADASLVATCAVVSAGTLALAALASWWGTHRVRQLEIMSILRLETGD